MHYRRTLSKCCFGITNTHAPLYSIIAPSAPALGGSFKSERFFSPHPTWSVGGCLRDVLLRKFLIEPFSKQNAMQANPLNQRRVGAEPMQLANLPPANNFWYISVERFQNVVLGSQTLTPHGILSSLHPRPPSVGVSKANAFSAPTLHG